MIETHFRGVDKEIRLFGGVSGPEAGSGEVHGAGSAGAGPLEDVAGRPSSHGFAGPRMPALLWPAGGLVALVCGGGPFPNARIQNPRIHASGEIPELGPAQGMRPGRMIRRQNDGMLKTES